MRRRAFATCACASRSAREPLAGQVPCGPARSVTFSHAFLKNTQTHSSVTSLFFFFYIRPDEAKRDWLKDRDTLPLVPPKSHCQRASRNSSLPRGKGDPESETRHARAYVRESACTKEPRAMWLERRARGRRDVILTGAPRVRGRFSDNGGMRDWPVSKWRNRGCSIIGSDDTDIDGISFRTLRAPFFSPANTLLRGYFFDKRRCRKFLRIQLI